LDANFNRLDYSERPELQKGTVDFVVSQSSDYWASNPLRHLTLTSFSDPTQSDVARIPQSIRYIFALDVSHTSILSGFLTSACVALRTIFYGRFSEDGSEIVKGSLPQGCSIALVTFDDAVHLYGLSVCTVFRLGLPKG
jgi:protein transport protein SEC24